MWRSCRKYLRTSEHQLSLTFLSSKANCNCIIVSKPTVLQVTPRKLVHSSPTLFHNSSSLPKGPPEFSSDPEIVKKSRRTHENVVPQVNELETDRYSWINKLVYSSFLNDYVRKETEIYSDKIYGKEIRRELEARESYKKYKESLPLSVVYKAPESSVSLEKAVSKDNDDDGENLQFPFRFVPKSKIIDDHAKIETTDESSSANLGFKREIDRLKDYGMTLEDVIASHEGAPTLESESKSETDLEQFKELETADDHGTEDHSISPSQTPCSGCGAFLHCQSQSRPGYVPSERFKVMVDEKDLQGQICQRCYYLQCHDTALSVNVSSEEYPEVINQIKDKFALALLIVDLFDFPCCIWPGLAQIVGRRRPIFVVGNKVDLLPQDSDKYLKHVKQCLYDAVVQAGFEEKKIKNVSLVSARTNFGIEDLIENIMREWGDKGDIFILGCTNVGKSSLFNAFLQSDLCKIEAIDMIQKATISKWPGTTLNLLKFPIMKPVGWRMAIMTKRRANDYQLLKAERRLRKLQLKEQEFKDPELTTPIGHLGRTFQSSYKIKAINSAQTSKDPFSMNIYARNVNFYQEGKWDYNSRFAKQGPWCYDTPGAVNENQLIDLLTLSELKALLPSRIIQPRTYFIKPELTVFIAGLARLDFVEGETPITYTVFTSSRVPVTVVETRYADEVYQKGLGTFLFGIPRGSKERIENFPPLMPQDYFLEGVNHKCSCADIVLSSIGWIAVTAKRNQRCHVRAYTPNGKGMSIRNPSLLPYAVNLKGKRLRDTPAYEPHRIFVSHKQI